MLFKGAKHKVCNKIYRPLYQTLCRMSKNKDETSINSHKYGYNNIIKKSPETKQSDQSRQTNQSVIRTMYMY